MRLLSTKSREMEEFAPGEIPPYGILSHTWVPGQEITLQEWTEGKGTEKSGMAKIQGAQELAGADGFDWVWIDTCCIDKTSSAELDEAINSMFRWYLDAPMCYAYLSDVPSADMQSKETQEAFAKSRWFTRGWTLQELLAPSEVRFYAADWTFLDTKSSLVMEISAITNIEEGYVKGERPLEEASVAMRMSWAAHRQTTRVEDRAYSLMGIFDINMSLIYGEGEKAFQRLQKEIMNEIPWDQTIFAWGEHINVSMQPDSEPYPKGTVPDAVRPRPERFDPSETSWDSGEASNPGLGLLAESPDNFAPSRLFVSPAKSQAIFYKELTLKRVPMAESNRVFVNLPFLSPSDWSEKLSELCVSKHLPQPRVVVKVPLAMAVLRVQVRVSESDPMRYIHVFLPLLRNRLCYSRTPYLIVARSRNHYKKPSEPRKSTPLVVTPSLPASEYSPRTGDVIFRHYGVQLATEDIQLFNMTFLQHCGVLRPNIALETDADHEMVRFACPLYGKCVIQGKPAIAADGKLRMAFLLDFNKTAINQQVRGNPDSNKTFFHNVLSDEDVWRPGGLPFALKLQTQRHLAQTGQAVHVVDLHMGPNPSQGSNASSNTSSNTNNKRALGKYLPKSKLSWQRKPFKPGKNRF